MNQKYYLSIISPKGEIVKNNLSSREVYRYFGKTNSPSGEILNSFKTGKLVKMGNHLIIETGKENIAIEKLSLKKKKKIADMEMRLKKDVGNVIVKLNSDLSLAKIYTSSLVDIANELGVSLGTIKSRLNRDIKIIRKILTTGSLNVSQENRFVYMSDIKDLI